MYTVLIVIHVMVTVALIGIILVQRSASDGMGLSGSSSTSFMSGRAAASFVTRTTSVLGAIFILSSLGLGVITAHNHSTGSSIIDKITTSQPATPATTDSHPAPLPPQSPQKPAKPSVPRPE